MLLFDSRSQQATRMQSFEAAYEQSEGLEEYVMLQMYMHIV